MSIELRSQHHLFRYASEWDPREKGKTKGGYLEGSIKLPPGEDGVKVVVSTYPAQLPPELEESCQDVHPTLLHLVRKTRARRMNELEPVPNIHHWRQELVIKGKEVSIVNKTSVADDGRDIPKTDKLFDLKEEQVLPFGKDAGELNLIILIPKSDARAQGDDVTLKNLLSNRIENKEILGRMDENFKGKKSVNLKQVKLKVDFYKLSDDSLISSAISPTISDTASKQLGALDFHDATPLKSCEKGGRKVIMVAEFGLATDVEPRFQLWDSQGIRLKEQEDKLLKQPKQPVDSQQKETVAVFKESIIFITPDQPFLSLIVQKGFKITLAGRRKSDGWESRKKFPFTYEGHITNCFFCICDPDGGESCEKGQAKLPLKKEGPRPGRKKRKMSETDDQGDVQMEPFSRPVSSLRTSTESRTASWSPNSEESVAVGRSQEDRESAGSDKALQISSFSEFFPSKDLQDSLKINEICNATNQLQPVTVSQLLRHIPIPVSQSSVLKLRPQMELMKLESVEEDRPVDLRQPFNHYRPMEQEQLVPLSLVKVSSSTQMQLETSSSQISSCKMLKMEPSNSTQTITQGELSISIVPKVAMPSSKRSALVLPPKLRHKSKTP